MESALYGVYTLVVLYQKSHSFASLTCSISYTPQLVRKHRIRALSMKYYIFFKYRVSIIGLENRPAAEPPEGTNARPIRHPHNVAKRNTTAHCRRLRGTTNWVGQMWVLIPCAAID